MADGADRLAGTEKVADKFDGLGVRAQPIGVGDAARQHQTGEVGFARLVDHQVDFDPVSLVGMLHALNLSRLQADHADLGAGVSERLEGLEQFGLLEAVGGQDGDPLASQFLLHFQSPACFRVEVAMTFQPARAGDGSPRKTISSAKDN